MYYGVINATATYKGHNKLYVATNPHSSIENADDELKRKIKALPRREYLSMFPFDTGVVLINKGNPIAVPEGKFCIEINIKD